MTQAFVRRTMDVELRAKILPGQFEQGLLSKRKRHLKYSLETFENGISQARMAEAIEEQPLGETVKGGLVQLTTAGEASESMTTRTTGDT